jgi:hypothetical protein
MKLELKDVHEFVIGAKGSVDIVDNIFQTLFQNPSWEHIIEKHESISILSAKVSSFLITQMMIEAAKEEERENSYRHERDTLFSELVNCIYLTVQNYCFFILK